MARRNFYPKLWDRDLSLLSPGQQQQARDALLFAERTLGCAPYHRKSKPRATSDHQTILQHPNTGKNCLVLSVVPDLNDRNTRVFRVDFFDGWEQIVARCGNIVPAPRKQWTDKKERRVYVSPSAQDLDIQALLQDVVCLATRRP